MEKIKFASSLTRVRTSAKVSYGLCHIVAEKIHTENVGVIKQLFTPRDANKDVFKIRLVANF